MSELNFTFSLDNKSNKEILLDQLEKIYAAVAHGLDLNGLEIRKYDSGVITNFIHEYRFEVGEVMNYNEYTNSPPSSMYFQPAFTLTYTVDTYCKGSSSITVTQFVAIYDSPVVIEKFKKAYSKACEILESDSQKSLAHTAYIEDYLKRLVVQ